MKPQRHSLHNLGIMRIFQFEKDDGARYAYLDFIDESGRLNTFKSVLVITDGKGKDLEVWDTEEKDTYDIKITNIQN